MLEDKLNCPEDKSHIDQAETNKEPVHMDHSSFYQQMKTQVRMLINWYKMIA